MAPLHLVTGGAGFIGSSLVRALVERGDRVRVIDDLSSGRRENLVGLEGRLELIEASILDQKALARALAGAEVVFHEAAIPSVPRSIAEPVPSHEVNATGTLRLLSAARAAGVRRVVYAASSSAYGETPTLPKVETMAPSPMSPYAVSKLAGEHYCRVFTEAYGLEAVSLRYFNVFGPRQDPASQYAAVIPRFITEALQGRPPVVYGDGTHSRDFCHIDNVIEANLKAAAAAGAAGRVFNIACGVRTTLSEVIRAIGDILGRTVAATHEAPRAGDIRHSLADISAARTVLGYAAAVSFVEGLRTTIDWYRSRPGGRG